MEKMKLNIQLFSIPHTYIEFEDFPSTDTPLTAANLNQMQSDIYDDIRENGGGSGETLKVGTILQFSGSTAPTGYMFCDGTAISRTDYATLFSVIGTTYGAGDGSTTFNLPNFNGRVAVGLDSNDSDFDTLGETGGEKTHTLTIDEMPSHTHIPIVTATAEIPGGGGASTTTRDSNGYKETNPVTQLRNTGGGQAHNNLQPYIVTKFIIKVADTTPVSAQIVDSYSESTTDGYSANYVNNAILDKYTSNETIVGTWIDNKPIYRKVITGSKSSVKSQIKKNILHYDKVIKATGWMYSKYDQWWPIPVYHNETGYYTAVIYNSSEISIDTGANYTDNSNTILVLEYTKTTD